MNKHRLSDEINYELAQMDKLAKVATQMSNLAEKEKRPWDTAAAAKYISDFILGLENICKRKNSFLNRKLPEGPDYHYRLLDDFLRDPDLGKQLSED